jgi:hypothetical protein
MTRPDPRDSLFVPAQDGDQERPVRVEPARHDPGALSAPLPPP